MKKIFFFTLLLVFSAVMVAQEKPDPVSPVFDENLFTRSDFQQNENVYTDGFATLLEAFTYGGDRLVAMQYTDGGWGWPLNAPPTYGNILGPIAMGLAQAYQQSGIAAHNTALLNAGAYLLTKSNNFSPSDGYLASQLDKIFGVTTYTSHVIANFYDPLAAGTYDRNGDGTLYNTAGYVNLIRTSRSGSTANLAAWDIGMGLVGAAMCGASTTEWIDGVKAEINELNGDYTISYYDVIGLAGAVYGLAYVDEDFDPTAGQHAAASNINDLAAILASYQIDGGGFAWNQAFVIPNDYNEVIQETAYAILALNEVDRTLYITNIEGAADYIMSVQLGTGGWSQDQYTIDENNEITGEALWGMSVAYPAPIYNVTKDVYYPTIQGAIIDANSGDLITIAAGTYPEGQIFIDKNLTIQGQGKDVTIVNSNYNTASSGHGNDASAWIRTAPSTMVNISDMTLDATGFDTYTALRFQSSGMVSDVHINEIKHSASQYIGIGIQVLDGNVDVTNCDFTEIGRIGVHYRMGVITGASVSGTYDGNTYTGKGSGDWLDYALDISGATTILVTNSTVTGNTGVALSDGSTSAGILASTYFPAGLNLPNDVTILNNVLSGNTDGIAVGFDGSDVSVVVANNNNIYGNITYGVNSTAPTVDAEYNWWGTAVESEIQALINGPVDYDPWIGKAEMVPVSQTTPTVYDFPIAGVKMIFTTLPAGGGSVTVQRYNEEPTPFPSGYENVGMWLDISSTMPNYSFDVTVKVDVDGLGFDDTQSVMYYNSTSSSWVAIPGGVYLASDADFGGHPSFSFVTNHFTPFTFINTPATAYDVYLSSSTSAASGFIYPNDSWGTTGYEPDDWDFTTPVTFYIVPEVGSVFGASNITIQWDNTMFGYVGVVGTGGIYNGLQFQVLHSQLGTIDQVIINCSRLDNGNFTIGPGDYIATLELNLLTPGFGPINFTALDFRELDGGGGFDGVYMTGYNTEVKSYLGDVASPGPDESTGDGLVDFDDLSPWSISYWSGVPGYINGMDYYKVKYDVGPTSDNTVYGLPTVDAQIQFEDLVIFAMSYGLSADNVYPKIQAEPTEPVELKLSEPIVNGNQTRIPLFVSGGVQNVRAMSLAFDGQFGTLLSVEKGSLLSEFENPVMIMQNADGNQVYVDLAVFGAEETGINREGELLTLVFEGNSDVNINSADVRNILNKPMDVNISGTEGLIPAEFALLQNYPNPFNPSTTINYELPEQAMVEISIFNAIGERVVTLVNEMKDPGRYSETFNAVGYSSGIYFYQIKANDFVSVKKMILMK